MVTIERDEAMLQDVLDLGEMARRIRAARAYAGTAARGMTQDDMADLLGISVVTYKRIEAGRREATAQEVQRICEISQMPSDWFTVQAVRNLRAVEDERLQHLEDIEERVGGLIDRLADIEYQMRKQVDPGKR